MSDQTSGNGALPPAVARDRVEKIELMLVNVTRFVIVALSASFTVIIIASVVLRYAFGDPIIWVEEIARFILGWIVFLGVSVAAYERGHVAVDALLRYLDMPAKGLLSITLNLLMILFLCVVVVEGLALTISVTGQISPSLEISYFWPYLSMPVGAALTIVHLLMIVRDEVRLVAQSIGHSPQHPGSSS